MYWPYYLLIALPAYLYMIEVLLKESHKRKEAISKIVVSDDRTGRVNKLKNQQSIVTSNCSIYAFFIFLFLLLSLRNKTIGRDLPNYEILFNSFGRSTLNQIIEDPTNEIGFSLFCKLIVSIGLSFRGFLVSCALISVLPIMLLYSEDRDNPILKIVLFISLPIFVMLFSGLRQSIAIALSYFAYAATKERKIARFVAVCVIAWSFHRSALALLFMYPAYHISFSKKHLYIVVLLLVALFLSNKYVFGLITPLFESGLYGKYTDISMTSTGAYGSIILYTIFTCMFYFFTDNIPIDRDTAGLRNLLIASMYLQTFAPLHSLAMRFNYYYILFIPLAMARCFSLAREERRDIAFYAMLLMIVFFVYRYLFSVTFTHGPLDTYPYYFMWN